MLAITCDKCRRRFTPTTEDLQGYLALGQGRKYTLVTCPHCGKGNKVAVQRVEQALRFSPAAPTVETLAAPPTEEEADSPQ
jgi:RNase P subunit RPR2